MSALDDFSDMMGTALVVTQPSTAARTMFGVKAYAAAASTFMAHVLEVNGVNRQLTGFDGYCSSVAWIASTSTGAIRRDSIVTFPDGSHPPVVTVAHPRDETGAVHHCKAVFG